MRLQHLSNYAFMLRRFQNGVELIRTLRGGNRVVEVIEWGGVRLRHPQGQNGFAETIAELWIDQCYTPKGFYQPRAGDIVVDAGAHVGLFSIWMARRNPYCHITALEPDHSNFQFLRANVSAAGLGQITALRMAIGSTEGWGAMRACTDRSIDHRLTPVAGPGPTSVSTVSLQGLLDLAGSDRVDFLKMDVEGAEHGAFANADRDTLSRFAHIALEYHDNLVPGTLDLLKHQLRDTHHVTVHPTCNRDYGILLGALRKGGDA